MRWRATKKALHTKEDKHSLPSYTIASFSQRAKAFIIDSFMLLMPILYCVFYLVFGSREGFAEHMLEGWLLILLSYGIISLFFLMRSGQTPGYKAYEFVLVDVKNQQKPLFLNLFIRYICMLLTTATLVGLVVPLLRKDKLALYDILSQTAPICK